MRNSKRYIVLLLFTLTLNILPELVRGQTSSNRISSVPKITQAFPSQVVSGMFIKLRGKDFGNLNKSDVYFHQNGLRIKANGSYSSGHIEGERYITKTVPEKLLPGICQIVMVTDGKESNPFQITILAINSPPTLESVKPAIAKPTEYINLYGKGFDDENKRVEFIDANGKQHFLKTLVWSVTSHISFILPADIPNGPVSVRLVGNRSGKNAQSNFVRFEVSRVAPLELFKSFYPPVAPGQWFIPNATPNSHLHGATRVEFELIQGKETHSIFIEDFKNVRFQIPQSFSPGMMRVRTRTWAEQEFSRWSKAKDYLIAERPLRPKVHSLEIMPVKGEAKFVQEGKEIDRLAVFLGLIPRTVYPEELENGKNLEVYTRFWKDNQFTEWKRIFNYSRFDGTSYKKKQSKNIWYQDEKWFAIDSFYNRFYFTKASPQVLEINRGSYLRIYGETFAGSVEDLEVVLKNSGEEFTLKPITQEFDSMYLIKVPNSLRAADWSITIKNNQLALETIVPKKIRVK